jgi:multidrug efflux pump subunit AcrB
VRTELIVRPDVAAAADLGVTTAAIGETLRIATVGDYEQSLAKLNLDKRQVPIVVKLEDKAKADLETIKSCYMNNLDNGTNDTSPTFKQIAMT